jgi:hypothetical protein
MRVISLFVLGAGAVVLGLSLSVPATAGTRNPDGVGMYTPAEPPVRHRPRLYRYDPRSWYYNQPRHYPYYGSGYWVPRAEMRYRYRYRYVGPKYRYYPAWGYGPASYRRWW